MLSSDCTAWLMMKTFGFPVVLRLIPAGDTNSSAGVSPNTALKDPVDFARATDETVLLDRVLAGAVCCLHSAGFCTAGEEFIDFRGPEVPGFFLAFVLGAGIHTVVLRLTNCLGTINCLLMTT